MTKRIALLATTVIPVIAAGAWADDPNMSPSNRVAYWDHIFEWSYTVFFALLALGAAGAIFAVVLGRRKYETVFTLGLALALFLCAISQQTCIDTDRGFIADQEKRYEQKLKKLAETRDKDELLRTEYLYLPVGDSMAYMTLGNTGLAADYLWLTSMQYVHSSFRRGHKFDLLQRLFSSMVDMDPHWVEAQTNAGKILSALEPDRFAVERFYIRCIRENPNDWRLPYGAGYLFIVPPLDLEKDQKEYSTHARAWIDDALRRPDFPQEMRSFAMGLKARLATEADFYHEAEQIFFQQATDPNSSEDMREIAARDWMNARSIVMKGELQSFIDSYLLQHQHYPRSLRQLFKEHPELSDKYATDAFGYEFEYEPETGKVASRGVNVRRALTVESVITPLIELYRGNNNGPPKDLKELGDWLKEYFSSASNPPSIGIKQAIGTDLDPTRSPLGKWNYDPVEGEITLPDWCNSVRLYQNVKKVIHLRDH